MDSSLFRISRTLALGVAIGACAPALAQESLPPFLPYEDFMGPTSYKTADLDGDGDMDLTDGVHWFENLGKSPPSFAPHLVHGMLRYLNHCTLVDFNRDGSVDIIGDSDLGLVLLLNDGSSILPTFEALFPIVNWNASWTYPVDLAVGDFDGDNRSDILFSSEKAIYLALQPKHLYEPWEIRKLLSFESITPYRLTVADMNNDGRDDFVAYGYSYENSLPFKIYLNQFDETPPFAEVELGQGIPQEIQIVDLDKNGDMDIVGLVGPSSILAWEHRQDDPLGFNVHTVSPALPSGRGLNVADFNQDGDLDILAGTNEGKVAWYEHNGDFGFTERSITTAEKPVIANMLAAIDLNVDGAPDVLFTTSSYDVAWYENVNGLYAVSASIVDDSGDGVLEQAESGEVRVRVKNGSGADTSDCSVTLVSKTAGLTFTQPIQNLGTLNSGETDDRTFGFTLDPTIECGAEIRATVVLSSEHGTRSLLLSMPVGETSVALLEPLSSPALVIPDADPLGVSDTINLGAPGGTLLNLEVAVDITHTYRGDLVVRLRSPRGIDTVLFRGSAERSANLQRTFSVPILAGEPADGPYTLYVADLLTGDVGTLNSWGLAANVETTTCLSGTPAPTPTTPSNDPAIVLANLNSTQWQTGSLSLFTAPDFSESAEGLGLSIASNPDGTFGAWYTREPLDPLPAGRYLIRAHIAESAHVDSRRHPEVRLRVYHATNERSVMSVAPEIVSGQGLSDVVEVIWQSDGISQWRVALDLLSFASDLEGGFTVTKLEAVPLP
ncbi:VCBS repeat-containing protein [bacterium]|nr:VCBS repeat-containing protein [bacterium]